MKIDVFTATGTKKGSLDLPSSLFEGTINKGLMHQAVMLQQSNRRGQIAHVKSRGEVAGSTAKLYAQKHTGRARRGSIRSPLLRGGGKAFGPRNVANFIKDMPKSMRRAALISCLSFRAKEGAILGLENYPDTIKTKDVVTLLGKMDVQVGRRVLFVVPETHKGLWLSSRNIPGAKLITASYLNPEDLLAARHIIFLTEAVAKMEELWGAKKSQRMQKMKMMKKSEVQEAASGSKKKTPTKAVTKKRMSKKSSASSESSAS